MPLLVLIVLFFVWLTILSIFTTLLGLTHGVWTFVALLVSVVLTIASNYFYDRYQAYSGLPDEQKIGFVRFMVRLDLGWLDPTRWFEQSVADDGSDPPLADVLTFLAAWGLCAAILSSFLWTWLAIVLGMILGGLALFALHEYVDFDEVTPSIDRFLRNAISGHPLRGDVSKIIAAKERASPLDGETLVQKIVERISQSSLLPLAYRCKRNEAQELALRLNEVNAKIASENAALRDRLKAYINLDADLRGIVEAGEHLRWVDDAQKSLVRNLARKHGMNVNG